MTEKQRNDMVTKWKKNLRLDHWLIEIVDEEPDNQDALASVMPAESYDRATIRFASSWPEWPPAFAERVVVHELLHIVFRDLVEAEQSIYDALSHDARVLYSRRLDHELEGVIDRLAERFVEVSSTT